MSKFLRYAAVGAAVASFGIASGAQAATTDSADVKAKILTTLTVAVDASEDALDFGSIADSGNITSSQTIDVATDGTRGACPVGLTCSGTTRAPLFHVTGANSKAVNISFLKASEPLAYQGTPPTGFANSTLSAGNFVTDAVNGVTTNQLLLSATGTGDFHVGGTLTVPADTAPGTYQGTLTVSVAYN
jgi:hypothetical protein